MITGISRFTKGEFNQAALDEVWNKGKETFKDPIAPPSSGIIVATTDGIWEDMHGENTGWCSNMPGGHAQYKGPVRKTISGQSNWNNLNMWFEIEEAGEGSTGCGIGISNSTNTRVETGWKRGYALMNSKTGNWDKYTESKTQASGSAHPHCDQVNFPWARGTKRCSQEGDDRFFNVQIQHRACPAWPASDKQYTTADGNLDFEMNRIESGSGFLSVRPQYYFRHHGWSGNRTFSDPSKVIAVYTEMYARLILHDPNGVDDRHLAKFVCHVSCDIRLKITGQDTEYIGDLGMTRYKMLTNDWQHFGFMSSDLSQSEFEANPPPFATTP